MQMLGQEKQTPSPNVQVSISEDTTKKYRLGNQLQSQNLSYDPKKASANFLSS